MRSITAGETVLEVYDSIKELPIKRYKLMQQYILQESGIGSDLSDIDIHLSKIAQFIATEKFGEAKEEITNLRYSFFSLMNGLSFKTKACACLVSGMEPEKSLPFIEAMTEGELSDLWESVKKKLIQNLRHTSQDGLELTLNMLTTSESGT